ncbi:protein Lilipod [Drosophila sulfurigaster albostrigata]|uniref:Protein Lilipod n=1 Tax=Drosophila albomicans TaxID=7291 RepID=A0A6P8XR91_DROAB|nr:protein Lilipod [Drosophila albomicans]XP_060649348.1 protein Lilipod isoform X1 [Drosophila nasuta]XP_062122308.1 protein Lilipod [Drosophila sulfurigaster albostrigata]
MDEEEDEVTDLKLQLFHNTVREHIIFLLLILMLYFSSYVVVCRFRRRDRDDLYSNDEDEVLIYRISFWLCTFTLAVAEGAAMLLPVSIASNEVLLLYPNSYYVKWLNSSLIQGLWNHVFLFSNLSLFIFLPFVYLFSESTGFVGYKKGILARVYETFTVFMLMAIIVLVLTAVLSAVFGIEKFQFFWFLNLGSVHLPFLYSCVSFLGVILMLICTPYGFVRLFGVVNQVLARPMLMRDVNEEFSAFYMEEASVKRKLAHIELHNVSISEANNGHGRAFNGSRRPLNYLSQPLLQHSLHLYQRKPLTGNMDEHQHQLNERLKELYSERKELDKMRKSSTFQRTFVYPLAMLLLLFCTAVTILLVVQNTLELLIGIKALPLSTRQFTLGISSLSKLGPVGAAMEVCLIFYLGATSVVGFYSMPFMRNVRPKWRKTSLPQLMLNCGFMLVLSSALPLLSRIIGITNFDLLGDFGAIEWLGNFQIVLLYNLVFGTTTALCLVNKFTAPVRRELRARLVENYVLFTNYMSFIN